MWLPFCHFVLGCILTLVYSSSKGAQVEGRPAVSLASLEVIRSAVSQMREANTTLGPETP